MQGQHHNYARSGTGFVSIGCELRINAHKFCLNSCISYLNMFVLPTSATTLVNTNQCDFPWSHIMFIRLLGWCGLRNVISWFRPHRYFNVPIYGHVPWNISYSRTTCSMVQILVLTCAPMCIWASISLTGHTKDYFMSFHFLPSTCSITVDIVHAQLWMLLLSAFDLQFNSFFLPSLPHIP